jgi:hypothetical protein
MTTPIALEMSECPTSCSQKITPHHITHALALTHNFDTPATFDPELSFRGPAYYISSFVRYVRLESTIYENLVGLTEVYPQQRCTVTPQCTPSESLVTPLQ